jgi:hypothetical protein
MLGFNEYKASEPDFFILVGTPIKGVIYHLGV